MDVVSVIIPCYNQARFLGEAVGSLARQTHADWECIIVNDGSSDNTRETAEELMRSDPRVRYVEQENQGLASARNRGLQEARGRYVQFLDADDTLVETKFERQIASMPPGPGLVVSYTDYVCYSESPGVQIPDFYRDPWLAEDNPLLDVAQRFAISLCIPVHSFLFDARIFRDHGVRFDTELPSCEDFACWLRVFRLKPAVSRVGEQLAVYRWHQASMTQSERRMDRGLDMALTRAILEFRDDPVVVNALARRLGVPSKYVYGEMSGIPKAIARARKMAVTLYRRMVPATARRALRDRINRARGR